MAERKQVNKYYPPDFDPAKHRSINKYRNSHPLRERAKKLSQGILVIRFEMPYNIWCGGCGNHIGMGVRYNAEKKKVGKYYTTPIYRFRMKCHLCDNYIEMETDPKNCDYTIVSGAQRKNQKWDMAENEQVLTEDREAVKKLARDAMYKLEHGVDDTKKLKKAAPTLSQIAEMQSTWKDDYSQNQLLRKKFRDKKKQQLAIEADDKALLARSSLEIDLVPETEEDKKLASLLKFSVTDTYEEKQKHKREEITSRPILASTISSPPSSSKETSPHDNDVKMAASKHSEAQKSLMSTVIKKRISGVFGGIKAKCSNANLTKSLFGSKGLVLVKKRKREEVEDDPEGGSKQSVVSDRDQLIKRVKSDVLTEKCASRKDDLIMANDIDATRNLSLTASSETVCSTQVHDTIREEEGDTRTENVDISHCDRKTKADDLLRTYSTSKEENVTGKVDGAEHNMDLSACVNRTVAHSDSSVDTTNVPVDDNTHRTGHSSSYEDEEQLTTQSVTGIEKSFTCTDLSTVSTSAKPNSEAQDVGNLEETSAEGLGEGILGQSSLSLVSCYSSSSNSSSEDEEGT